MLTEAGEEYVRKILAGALFDMAVSLDPDLVMWKKPPVVDPDTKVAWNLTPQGEQAAERVKRQRESDAGRMTILRPDLLDKIPGYERAQAGYQAINLSDECTCGHTRGHHAASVTHNACIRCDVCKGFESYTKVVESLDALEATLDPPDPHEQAHQEFEETTSRIMRGADGVRCSRCTHLRAAHAPEGERCYANFGTCQCPGLGLEAEDIEPEPEPEDDVCTGGACECKHLAADHHKDEGCMIPVLDGEGMWGGCICREYREAAHQRPEPNAAGYSPDIYVGPDHAPDGVTYVRATNGEMNEWPSDLPPMGVGFGEQVWDSIPDHMSEFSSTKPVKPEEPEEPYQPKHRWEFEEFKKTSLPHTDFRDPF